MGCVCPAAPGHAHRHLLLSVTRFNLSGRVVFVAAAVAARRHKAEMFDASGP